MLDFTHFHAVFPADDGPKPYDQNGAKAIETFRKTFDGVLFVDRVLRALGIKDPKAYPPKGGDAGLRHLHHQILESPGQTHHKLSVLYYLLLDHDDVRGARSQLASLFAEDTALPQKYQILMRGLWHMDRKEFKVRPSLPPSYQIPRANPPSSPSNTSPTPPSPPNSPTKSPRPSSATPPTAPISASPSPTITPHSPSSKPPRHSTSSSARSRAPRSSKRSTSRARTPRRRASSSLSGWWHRCWTLPRAASGGAARSWLARR